MLSIGIMDKCTWVNRTITGKYRMNQDVWPYRVNIQYLDVGTFNDVIPRQAGEGMVQV